MCMLLLYANLVRPTSHGRRTWKTATVINICGAAACSLLQKHPPWSAGISSVVLFLLMSIHAPGAMGEEKGRRAVLAS